MGTPDFAVPTLQHIIELGCQVVGVVSQPNRRKGRGRQLVKTPVAQCAENHGLPIFQWPRLNNDSFATLSAMRPDVAVVVAYGKILPQRYLTLPGHGCLNVHASVLPALRGAAPIQWAVIRGCQEAGVSIMRLDEGMDTGDVALIRTLDVGPNETSGELHDRLSQLGAEALRDALTQLVTGTLQFHPQDHSRATHAPRLEKRDGLIDWSQPAQTIHDHVRGMSPWPGAFMETALGPLKFHGTVVVPGTGQAGQIIGLDPLGPSVACGEQAVRILRIQRPGKRVVSGADYARGLGLRVGDPIEGPADG